MKLIKLDENHKVKKYIIRNNTFRGEIGNAESSYISIHTHAQAKIYIRTPAKNLLILNTSQSVISLYCSLFLCVPFWLRDFLSENNPNLTKKGKYIKMLLNSNIKIRFDLFYLRHLGL